MNTHKTTQAAWLLTAVLCCGTGMARAQSGATADPKLKDDLFAGTEKFAANASSVTEVDMDPDELGMVNGPNATRARRTLLSVVHTYTYDKPGMYNMADVDAYRNKLNTGDWHCSVHVRELKSGESTDICRHHRTDDLDETAIITVEPRELTFIHTIKRPYAAGTKRGGDSLLLTPGGDGVLAMDGMPAQAWAAEIKAQGAVMRAEMAALRPEMLAEMAAARAGMTGFRMDLYRSPLSAGQLERLGRLPLELHRALPPANPGQPLATPAVPQTPAAPAPR